MKKFLLAMFALVLMFSLGACGSNSVNYDSVKPSPSNTSSSSEYSSEAKSSSGSSYSSGKTSSFTNEYGTSTTKCAHYGCDNYVASSGDTNCCTTHSRKCLECKKYIDEDAMYCLSCIQKAANQVKNDHSKY